MVPQGHRVESILDPDESVFGMRTSVHEIPNSEEAIPALSELELVEGPFKRAEAAMDVADHEVSTGLVDTDDTCVRHDGLTERADPQILLKD